MLYKTLGNEFSVNLEHFKSPKFSLYCMSYRLYYTIQWPTTTHHHQLWSTTHYYDRKQLTTTHYETKKNSNDENILTISIFGPKICTEAWSKLLVLAPIWLKFCTLTKPIVVRVPLKVIFKDILFWSKPYMPKNGQNLYLLLGCHKCNFWKVFIFGLKFICLHMVKTCSCFNSDEI